MQFKSDIELGVDLFKNLLGLPTSLAENMTLDDVVGATGLLSCRDPFQAFFGEPSLTNSELAMVHFHSSARNERIDAIVGTKEHAKSLCELGKLATAAATAVAVYESASQDAGAQEIDSKVAFIGNSHAVLRALHDKGLCRTVVGSGMLSLTSGNERGVFGVCQEVMHRYVGHLFITREWKDFIQPFKTILDVPAKFPFSSYSETNSKSMLQKWTQHTLDSVPRYDLVDEQGPDHDKRFRVVAWGGKTGKKRLGEGIGRTVKEAEMAAASNALATVAHPDEIKATELRFEDIPQWLRTRCESIGTQVLADVTDQILSAEFRDAVLIPQCKQSRFRCHLLRERLGVVGSRVRQLVAFRHAITNRRTCSDAIAQVSFTNNNRNLCDIVTGSPLGKWIEALRRTDMFEASDQKGPLIDTLNALLGALVIQTGFEGAKSIESVLFRGRSVASVQPAKQKLQQVIQEVVKDRFVKVFQQEVAMLHSPHEAHRARIEVTLRLAGVEIGRAEAGNKKDAAEQAAQKALVNPRLIELLAGLREV